MHGFTLHPIRRQIFVLPLTFFILCGISHNVSAQIYVIGSSAQFGTVDPTTGSINVIGTTITDFGPTVFSGLAWTPNNGNFYSVAGIDGDRGLYRINPTTAATTYLRNIGTSLVTITSRTDGMLFGYSSDTTASTSTLWRINPLTEMLATQVGAAGALGAANAGGLVFDNDDNLYLINSDTGQLSQVSTTNGTTTPVGAATGTTNVYGMAPSTTGYYGFSATDRGIYPLTLSTGTTTSGATYSFGPSDPLALIYGTAGVIPEPATGCLMLVGVPLLLRKLLIKA